jgi:hypothetical protein
MVRDASLMGSDIATGRQWPVQFVLREALVRDDKGCILDAMLSTIAGRKAGTLIAPANAIIVSTRETMMEPPSLLLARTYCPTIVFR